MRRWAEAADSGGARSKRGRSTRARAGFGATGAWLPGLCMVGAGMVAASMAGCAAAPEGVAAPSDASAQAGTNVNANAETDAPGGASSVTPGEGEPLRVLVTGFNDWRDLGTPPNVWRCRDNPSCRLLLGGAQQDAPTGFEGPLVAALQEASEDTGRAIAWSFATLPVTWDVAQTVDYAAHDVVVHVGLGVYDRHDAVFVEAGAFNRRRGTDAAGEARDEPVDARAAETLAAPETVASAIAAVHGRSFGGLEAVAMAARESNAYLCNETYFRALQAVEENRRTGGRLGAAYFVHIPYAQDDDYRTLARGVAGVISALLPVSGDEA